MKVIRELITEAHRRQDAARLLLWLIMFVSLLASMRHVAWVFTTLEGGNVVSGWLSALAFDSSIFLLTFLARASGGQRKHERRVIKCGIIANGLLTVLANLLYGLEHQITLERVPYWLWISLPFVFSVALPLMVIYLAEVLSAEEQHDIVAEQRRHRREQKSLEFSHQDSSQPSHNDSQKAKIGKNEKLRIVGKLVSDGCNSVKQIAEKTGFSLASVYRYLEELGISLPYQNSQKEPEDNGETVAEK